VLDDNRLMSTEAPEPLGRFLTVADTAEILNVAPADVLALVRSSELPAIRVGSTGKWRIERSVLESYIEAMYEESRRRSLWEQSDFASIPELSGGTVIRPAGKPGT
jgi:excisionase family DNA binding protein